MPKKIPEVFIAISEFKPEDIYGSTAILYLVSHEKEWTSFYDWLHNGNIGKNIFVHNASSDDLLRAFNRAGTLLANLKGIEDDD